MKNIRPLTRWSMEAKESITILNDEVQLHYRIYNRGPGTVTVLDQDRNELACLVAGNCLDFDGDHFQLQADGPAGSHGLYQPIEPPACGPLEGGASVES
jgi:hypothetical protein